MKYKYHAKCSQCGRGFRANTRSELLRKLRKHLWRFHADWMKRRIKLGLKRAKAKGKQLTFDVAGQSLISPQWIGFAERGLIEKTTGLPYEEVKSRVLDFFVQMALGGVKKPKA